jgi:hypothetical protein
MLIYSLPSWPGLSPQVAFTRLAALNIAELGQARVPMASTSLLDQGRENWMPGSPDKFTASALA